MALLHIHGFTSLAGSNNQVGLARAPARCATAVSQEMTRSRLSMAAAVLFLATMSIPYLGESHTQHESAFPVLENRRATTGPDAGAGLKDEGRNLDIAVGGEDGKRVYSKEGGKRIDREGGEALKKLGEMEERLDARSKGGWGKPGAEKALEELQKDGDTRKAESKNAAGKARHQSLCVIASVHWCVCG